MDVIDKYGLEVFGFLDPHHARCFIEQNLGDGRRFLNVEIAAALLGCSAAARDVLVAGLNSVRQPKVLGYLDDYKQARCRGAAAKKQVQTIQKQARDTLVARLWPWLKPLSINYGVDIVSMLSRPDQLPIRFNRKQPHLTTEITGERYGVPLPPPEAQPRLDALTATTEFILDFWYRHSIYRHFLGSEWLEKILPLVGDDYSRTLVTLALDDIEDTAFTLAAATRRAALCSTLDRRLRLMGMAVLLLTNREGNDIKRAETLLAAAAGELWSDRSQPEPATVTRGGRNEECEKPEDEVTAALHRIAGKPVTPDDRVKVDRWQSDEELITALLRLIKTCDGTIMWAENRFADFDPYFRWGLFGPGMGGDWQANLIALDQRRPAIVAEFNLNLQMIECFCLGIRNHEFPLMLLRKACAQLPATMHPKNYPIDLVNGPW